ncbi:MAG: hypothetical protein ACOY4U_04485 [Pseudomonadota bacterium]
MFKIGFEDHYVWPVEVEVNDGSVLTRHTFDAHFRRLPTSKLDSLMERVQSREASDTQLLGEVLVGWDGVKDAGGNDFGYSEKNRAILIEVYPVRPALVAAFFDSIKRGREKN